MLSLPSSPGNSPALPQLIETHATFDSDAPETTPQYKSLNAAESHSTSAMLACGAITCAHWTSSDSSTSQLETSGKSTRGGLAVPPDSTNSCACSLYFLKLGG